MVSGPWKRRPLGCQGYRYTLTSVYTIDGGGLVPAVRFQLFQNIVNVILDRSPADYQLIGDLAIGVAGANEAQYLSFARSEFVKAAERFDVPRAGKWLLGQLCETTHEVKYNIRRNERLPGMHCMNLLDQLRHRLLARDVPDSACFDITCNQVRIVWQPHNDNP